MEKIETSGLYIISDQYYIDFPSTHYARNKNESRPHYYAFQDNDGIFWMIPLSTQVENYRKKITNIEKDSGTGSCFMYCIAQFHGNDRAVLICNMFPVSEKYILRPYTISGLPYIVKNETIRKTIRTKALRYLSMVKRGKIKNPLNVLEIKEKLLESK